jgi:hypothetical protein
MSSNAPLMRCHEARPYLAAYADGELDETLRERVETHIASCAACRQEVARYQAIDELIGALPGSTPSPAVLDRVLAATSSANKEHATRESLRQPEKPLAPRTLPAFILADANQAAPLSPMRQRMQKRRSWLVASALPTLAALLIITFTFVAFHNRPGAPSVQRQPTPTVNVQTTLQQTNGWISQHGAQLGFTPLVPAYLPPGAQFDSSKAKIGHFDDGTPVLDITWNLSGRYTDLHLRETAEPLTLQKEYVTTPGNSLLSWQIVQLDGQALPQWQQILQSSPSNPGSLSNRLAIYEQRQYGQQQPLYIILDIGAVGGFAIADLLADSNLPLASSYLRLTSLSIDMKTNNRINLNPQAPSQNAAVHYQAQTVTPGGGQSYLWDVYSYPTQSQARATLSTSSGQSVFVEYWDGTGVQRFHSTAGGAYQQISSAEALMTDPLQLSLAVWTQLGNASSNIRNGTFWYIGTEPAPASLGIGKRQVEVLTDVTAPYPTTIYVDSATNQIVAVVVDTNSPVHPGGIYAPSIFAASASCLNYTSIIYPGAAAITPYLTAPAYQTVQQVIPSPVPACS